MKKIFLVEDDPEIAELLSLHFTEPYYKFTSCSSGLGAIEQINKDGADLVILDIMLPDIDGFEVCKMIRKNQVAFPILMLTSLADETDKVLGLELGADDYVTKPFGIRELMARTKALLRRYDNPGSAISHEDDNTEIVIKDLAINKYKRQAMLNDTRIDLTAKEFDLLYLLASNKGKTFSRDEILRLIWGYTFKGYEHTVTSHINRLRIKLEPDINTPYYILTSWGVGYRFIE